VFRAPHSAVDEQLAEFGWQDVSTSTWTRGSAAKFVTRAQSWRKSMSGELGNVRAGTGNLCPPRTRIMQVWKRKLPALQC